MKLNNSFESIFLKSSVTRLEIKFSSPLGELISDDNRDGRESLCSRPVLEKSLSMYPFEILPHLGEN